MLDILRDPGAASQDDVIFSGVAIFWGESLTKILCCPN